MDQIKIGKFIAECRKKNNLTQMQLAEKLNITDKRLHHEIYLSDPRKCDVNKLKTVIRHPIKKI